MEEPAKKMGMSDLKSALAHYVANGLSKADAAADEEKVEEILTVTTEIVATETTEDQEVLLLAAVEKADKADKADVIDSNLVIVMQSDLT